MYRVTYNIGLIWFLDTSNEGSKLKRLGTVSIFLFDFILLFNWNVETYHTYDLLVLFLLERLSMRPNSFSFSFIRRICGSRQNER